MALISVSSFRMHATISLEIDGNLLANNARGLVLFKESGTNRNTIGKNALVGNKTATEGFDPAPELEKVEGELAEGEFTIKGAKGFGLSDAGWVKPLWERWNELRKGAGGAK